MVNGDYYKMSQLQAVTSTAPGTGGSANAANSSGASPVSGTPLTGTDATQNQTGNSSSY
jgi:hypothetical protein